MISEKTWFFLLIFHTITSHFFTLLPSADHEKKNVILHVTGLSTFPTLIVFIGLKSLMTKLRIKADHTLISSSVSVYSVVHHWRFQNIFYTSLTLDLPGMEALPFSQRPLSACRKGIILCLLALHYHHHHHHFLSRLFWCLVRYLDPSEAASRLTS